MTLVVPATGDGSSQRSATARFLWPDHEHGTPSPAVRAGQSLAFISAEAQRHFISHCFLLGLAAGLKLNVANV